jgi:formylglycine-generating enzyme required for sulfatase activity
LPTEAEWELAAKAEQGLVVDGRYTWFSGGANASLLAWHSPNAQQKVHPVGGKYPNAFGLYDMSGNVSEWVWDGYTPHLRDGVNPKGVRSKRKSVRGGHYLSPITQIRVFDRSYASQSYRSETIGFRIVRSIR